MLLRSYVSMYIEVYVFMCEAKGEGDKKEEAGQLIRTTL